MGGEAAAIIGRAKALRLSSNQTISSEHFSTTGKLETSFGNGYTILRSMSGISVVFGGKKSTLQRSELPAAAALRCGAIISAPTRIFTAWTLIRTAKFTNATVLKYSSAIRLTGHSGEIFAQRCRSWIS